jgi:putative sigma-54 modulation protein
MNINIQTVHFDADEKLLAFVENKVSKLQTFHDNITRVEVFLKLDNLVHNIKDKIVEIKVHIPKQDCFVKATTKSFELSFDQALDSVINQLKKKKDRVAVVY